MQIRRADGADARSLGQRLGSDLPSWRTFAASLLLGVADLAVFWEPREHASVTLVILLAVVGYTALAWRMTAPSAIFAVMLAQLLLAYLLTPGYIPTLGLLLALYTVAARESRLRAGIAGALTWAAYAWAAVLEAQTAPAGEKGDTFVVSLVLRLLVVSLAWGLGNYERSRRRYVDEVERRREAERRADVAIERNRIAGELHDIVGHAVTVVVLHAAGARRHLDENPVEAEESLRHIEEAAKQAMTELRRVLKLLHTEEDVAGSGAEGPIHGVEDIATVVEVMRIAGLDIQYREQGNRRVLDPSAGLAAYRIVQESLTNVAKHVGLDAHVVVSLDWRGQELLIRVQDDGSVQTEWSAVTTEGGHGLLALRERVRAAKGELTVRINKTGGSVVEAQLPVASA